MEAAGYMPALEPDKRRKGETFRKWRRHVMKLGYVFEDKNVFCYENGDPTTRKRLFARFQKIEDKGHEINWPNPTYAKPDKDGNVPEDTRPWVTARDIINWENKGISIFERHLHGLRPLAKSTRRRLSIGLARYGLKGLEDSLDGFILPQQAGGAAAKSADTPVSPVTTKSGEGIAHPFIVPSQGDSARDVDKPAQTMACESARGERVIQPFILRFKGQSHSEDMRPSMDCPGDSVCLEFPIK